jgi:hypothetical protein
MTVPSARGPALNFLSRRMPAVKEGQGIVFVLYTSILLLKTIMKDITELVGRDIGLMIRAFAASLEDEHLLVKRSVLDLLHQALKMDTTAFKRSSNQDQTFIMRAAIGVVLRRDLTLNRRLYTWLVGSKDDASDMQIAYFKKHSLPLLASTLRVCGYRSPKVN